MKLFLNGGGSGKKTALANKKFGEVIDHTKPLLYVPLAMKEERYPSCLEWITKEMSSIGITNIDMVTSKEELYNKNYTDYCAIYIGGGNTYKLLNDLKSSGSFEKIKDYLINEDGVVFGGSAGAIIFGYDIDSCSHMDENYISLNDKHGFNLVYDYSIGAHYTNKGEEFTEMSTRHFLKFSRLSKTIALPEEDTIFIDNDSFEVIGNKPYYIFNNGEKEKINISNYKNIIEDNKKY